MWLVLFDGKDVLRVLVTGDLRVGGLCPHGINGDDTAFKYQGNKQLRSNGFSLDFAAMAEPAAIEWLSRSNEALGGQEPIMLCSTDIEAKQVRRLLHAMARGRTA